MKRTVSPAAMACPGGLSTRPSAQTTEVSTAERRLAKLVAEALRRAGKEPTREKLIAALEGGPFELGGYKVAYSSSNHNGSRFVDLTVLSRDGRVLR